MIKPLGALILIKKIQEEEKTTKSGLVLTAATVDNELKLAEVLALGSGEHNSEGKTIPIDYLNVGDIVYFNDRNATEITDEDNEKYLIISAKNIIALRG
jgi:co-chaperonin GroES (HSP10)